MGFILAVFEGKSCAALDFQQDKIPTKYKHYRNITGGHDWN
jgi:hypothetical protein